MAQMWQRKCGFYTAVAGREKCAGLLAQSDIDGGLIGGASLKAETSPPSSGLPANKIYRDSMVNETHKIDGSEKANTMAKQPLMLMILDGFGIAPQDNKNAIWLAKTPNLEHYIKDYPHTTLDASGMSVGLPDGQMGNSEVGHTNIGAGRVVYQELTRITKAIAEKTFFDNEALSGVMDACKAAGKKLHIMGLLSDGGVHSHNTHLYALLEMAKQKGLTEVYVHCFLDGRDVPPDSGLDYVRQLEAKIQEIGCGKIASVMGRYYAMDRDNRWGPCRKSL